MQKSMMLAGLLLAAGCQRGVDVTAKDQPKLPPAAGGSAAPAEPFKAPVAPAPPTVPQVPAPTDVAAPPTDAVKTPSGLRYKKFNVVADGVFPSGNDTVQVNYTVWKPTGETIFFSEVRGQPVPISLSNASPGFAEALRLIRKGEKARLWVPAELGEKTGPGANIATVYDVEVVDVQVAPKVPADVGAAPANAKTSPTGTKYVLVKAGNGAKARSFDDVTFHYTVWEASGKMMDSSETRNRPATAPPFKMPTALADMLTMMAAGQRTRFWLPPDQVGSKGDTQGMLCFEVELVSIAKPANAPPATPSDVKAPPAGTATTAKGVAYRVLKAGAGGPKPSPTDTVSVHYTGWTTDGKMFDTSRIGEGPAAFSLAGVMPGWTEAFPVMSVGDHVRFWIPAELAFKGAPGKPQGMLVYDVELLDFKPAAAGGGGAGDEH
ncbi:MAG: FKBP-type peptidyl-prolyl cis-trans isomerase [Kofleriaceae bacterium]|nr:FKBP-type peptidyl-prolyl cis-trans isomerase [Kofleriaceae bacterium]